MYKGKPRQGWGVETVDAWYVFNPVLIPLQAEHVEPTEYAGFIPIDIAITLTFSRLPLSYTHSLQHIDFSSTGIISPPGLIVHRETTANMNREIKAWTWTHGGFPKALQKIVLPADKEPLKPLELRVRVKAASINPVDAQLMGFPLLPYIPNFVLPTHKGLAEDFSGVVEEAGKDSGFKAGDEVFGIVYFVPGGTLQEGIKIDVKTSVVLPKPADWSWEQAGALPLVWLTAQTMIHLVDSYVKNKKVVVLGGSSGTGMYAVWIAKQRGWDVVATCSSRNSEFVKSMGAIDTIDYTTVNVREAVKKFAPDAIIDCVGGTDCIGIASRYVTVVGDKTSRSMMSGRNIYFWNPQMVFRALLGRAGLGRSYTCVNMEFKYPYLKEIFNLPKDKIIIDSTFSFDQVKEAFDRLNTGRTRGKVVVQIDA
ncbi:putative Enoyl reductase (ER) domain-containing protein [Seiridium unicorne]|uniref:Enoyl reductase (ER) domain-containing protein n=1 Tax=Seiridium unicorne TaxID=138068 RepID=A0ABR2V4H5_9PEZI